MDIFLLYLFTRVDAIQGLFFALTLISGVFIFGTGMFAAMSCSEYEKNVREWCRTALKKWTWLPVLCATLTVATPTQKDLAIIVGGHFAIEAAQSDTAKKIYSIVTDTLDDKLAEIARRKKNVEAK